MIPLLEIRIMALLPGLLSVIFRRIGFALSVVWARICSVKNNPFNQVYYRKSRSCTLLLFLFL